MDKSELARHLLAIFLEELDEHVATFNRDLLALEQTPTSEERTDLLQSVFRAAHSLKGASRAVNVSMIEQACHALEDLLTAVVEGKRQLSKDLFAMFFKAADAIEEAGMRLREKNDLEGAPLAELLPRIQAFVTDMTSADTAANEPGGDNADQVLSDADWQQPAHETAELALAGSPTANQSNAARLSTEAPTAEKSTASGPPPSGKRLTTPASSVRIAAEKLDTLLAQAGELLVARQRVELGVEKLESVRDSVAAWRRERRSAEAAIRRKKRSTGELSRDAATPQSEFATFRLNSDRMRQLERDLDRLVIRARSDVQYLGQVGIAIEDDVHRARMLPFSEACQGLERAIRDVATSVGKQVRLELVGADVQVDRAVLDGLKDPLLHIVRNAVDHGIEAPAKRAQACKPELATITVRATLRSGSVEVQVRDDGNGIDLQRIEQKALLQGISVPQAPHELARLIFLPAFSTATKVSAVSGRGVGLDVVRAEIERLHGSVDVTFRAGEWTCFSLTVPLTLTTIRAVLVSAAGQTFAIPTVNIDRIVRFDRSDYARSGGRSVLLTDGEPLALNSLANVLGMSREWELHPSQKMLAVVMVSAGQRVAFAVDDIAAESELTVKTLGPRVRRLRHVSGATLLPTGEISLVLNASNLIRTAADTGEGIAVTKSQSRIEPQNRKLLVVDDSVTSRILLRSILKTAGYDVSVAVDGQQALDMVRNTAFDLVVSDVDMPKLDGFALTQEVRKVPGSENLPIILITARSSDEDRVRGVHAGANAYIVKSGFDQTRLLQAVSDML